MKIKSIALSLLLAFSGISLVAMQGPTYYETLGVSREATLEKITKKYRKLAMKNHPDKNLGDKAAEERFKNIATAYDILKDADVRIKYDDYLKFPTGKPFNPLKHDILKNAQARQEYQQAASEGGHFSAYREAQQDKVMLLAGIVGANKTYSYLTLAWEQYTMQKNFAAIKKHVALQLKNKQENKPIATMREALDLNWVTRLRQGSKISPIEQVIEQFDRLVIQDPQSLPVICPQLNKIVDTWSDAIGNSKISLFKAAAIVGAGVIGGYVTSDRWLPKLLSLNRFDVVFIALRFLFS